MSNWTGKLTAVGVKAAKRGMHGDGGGLYLQVTGSGARSWIFRYTTSGRTREMGLGSARSVTLAEARDKAAAARRQTVTGVDPIAAREQAKAEAAARQIKSMTFRQCAEAYIKAHSAGWKNPKHAAQWPSTLETYAYPVFGKLPVETVDTGLVMKMLEPIWSVKNETASRVRGRIESVLDWAKVLEYRTGENPARWRGHLDHLLPARSKVAKVEHHAALPFEKLPDFMKALAEQRGQSARALEFCILTAARSGEVRGARWEEIDLEKRLWTVPAARMKAEREHRVPLSDRAVQILETVMPENPENIVFAGARPDRPLSDMSLSAVLRRMKVAVTVHGFRSTFRDWCGEMTSFPREVAEAALAHVVGDKVEAAYRRGDALEKRRKLMDERAGFCYSKARTNPLKYNPEGNLRRGAYRRFDN